MLPPKIIALVFFVWVIASVLGSLYELDTLTTTEQTMINGVTYYKISTTEGTWGAIELAAGAGGWLTNTWRMAAFQFSFVTGETELVRWIIFLPLTAMVVYGLVMTGVSILRGTI